MNASKHPRFLFGASLLSLLGLWWLLRPSRVPEPEPKTAALAAPSASAQSVASHAAEFPPETAESALPFAAPTPSRLEDVLGKYKEFAIYPPFSRPHNESTRYKLSWNEPVVSKLPFSDKPERPIHYKFASDKAHVLAGRSLTSFISAWAFDDESKRVPVKVLEAWVMVTSGPTPGRAVKLAYADNGANGDEASGDLVYTNRFVPSEAPQLKTAESAQIMAFVEIEGIQKSIVRDFTYSPRDVLTFGAVTDEVKSGSLVVDVAVDVHDAGEYTCEANLMSGDGGHAIAYSKEKPTWAVGPAKLSFSFFGKVLHDSWMDGPYLVRDIRCVLRQSGTEENVWAADDRTHTTKPYAVENFSDTEWSAPEKSDRISMLSKLLAQAKSGENPYPEAPKHVHVGPDGKEQVIVGADGKQVGATP